MRSLQAEPGRKNAEQAQVGRSRFRRCESASQNCARVSRDRRLRVCRLSAESKALFQRQLQRIRSRSVARLGDQATQVMLPQIPILLCRNELVKTRDAKT